MEDVKEMHEGKPSVNTDAAFKADAPDTPADCAPIANIPSDDAPSGTAAPDDTVLSDSPDSDLGNYMDTPAGDEPAAAEAERKIILRCESLSKSYGEVRALDGISFEIPEGKIIGLLGPNGSGKTTFIKIVAGLLTADSGRVTVDGHEIGVESKAIVAYLPERNSIPEHFTVNDAIDFYATFFNDFDKARAEKMLGDLRVDKRQKIKSLSKGTKEKVQLVMVMARRARLYILDEPISGVDPAARDYIIGTIINNYSPNSSVIISTHLISDIEKVMDGFIFLKYGRIACIGTPEGLEKSLGKTVDEYFREVFRC